MDKSETYIKMCDCPEIQERFAGNDGDVTAYLSECDVTGNPRRINTCWPWQAPTEDFIWLPRQEDLQEMLYEYWWGDKQPLNKVSSAVQKLVWWMDGNITKYCTDSMEQLWLAFVMKELHNKIWDEDKWK